ncbi:hypothetical protein ACVOMV_34420 [Mesorhizobium atlanticum]
MAFAADMIALAVCEIGSAVGARASPCWSIRRVPACRPAH